MSAGQGQQPEGHEEFVLKILECQGQVYAYILSLVLNRERARDLLQQTNVVLLEKESEFELGTNFGAWACRVAFYEVLSYRRSMSRDRHLFNEQLLTLIAEDAEGITVEAEDRLEALRICLGKLSKSQQQLVQARYRKGGSVKEIATVVEKTPNAISAELHRIRNALADCISQRLGGNASV